ncbi:37S ribosomal protein S24, mitochondrial [Tieghemiomyces parasiticus]|uniref:37S ribosomal protein S24, mitochondrial n=1 Tax=Tieghemiomyces parasiticus TaxID=78921 RepID=A0A9W7ZJP2_9FUNG|nr:37S ribosomal protein S24, mitochondrial [Tieghemiomyces parasiticus]
MSLRFTLLRSLVRSRPAAGLPIPRALSTSAIVREEEEGQKSAAGRLGIEREVAEYKQLHWERTQQAESLGELGKPDEIMTRPGYMLYLNVLEVEKYIHKLVNEVPNMADLHKPFKLPVAGCEIYRPRPPGDATLHPTPVPKSVSATNPVLKFRSAHYAFEENHSNAHSIRLTVALAQLGLTAAQRHKLNLLVGARGYMFERDEVVLTCKDFPTRAENKAELVRIFSELLAETRKAEDQFTDVPAPAISHRRRKRHLMRTLRFPKEWNRPQPKAATMKATPSPINPAPAAPSSA